MFKLDPQLVADTITIGDLPLCRLLLINDSQYPWCILVPRRNDIQEMYQLDETDQKQLMIESNTLGTLLMSHFEGDKLNVAALGNMVPQLHIHHIVRYKTDPAWPKPVWGALPNLSYEQQKLDDLVSDMTKLVASKISLQAC